MRPQVDDRDESTRRHVQPLTLNVIGLASASQSRLDSKCGLSLCERRASNDRVVHELDHVQETGGNMVEWEILAHAKR